MLFLPEVPKEFTKTWNAPFLSDKLGYVDGPEVGNAVAQAKGLMRERPTQRGCRNSGLPQTLQGRTMSTLVVQERHLWLNLVQMRDAEKQAGLFECSPFARRSPKFHGFLHIRASCTSQFFGVLQPVLYHPKERWGFGPILDLRTLNKGINPS